MESKRLYYLDWLRALVVLSLIPFHAALTYLRYGIVYIKAPLTGIPALPFLLVTVPLGDFFMSLMFFIAGVAAYYSLRKRSGRSFLAERAHRLLLPLALGSLLLCSVTGYCKALYEGFQDGFLAFLPKFLVTDVIHYNGYGHLWFLLYLFVFSAVCLPLFLYWKKHVPSLERLVSFLVKGNRILIPFGLVVLFELCLRPFFSDSAYIIITDWANDAVYLSLFIFGYVFASDERILERFRSYDRMAKILFALSLAGLFYVNIQSQVFYVDSIFQTIVWVLSKGIYESAAIVLLVKLGSKRWNTNNGVLRYLSKATFPIYILHFLPVTFFTLILIRTNLPNFLKFTLTVLLSYATVWILYECWRRIGIFLSRRKNDNALKNAKE